MWAPHGHTEAIEALRRLGQVVLLDSVDDPEVGEALDRAQSLADSMHVVDMAWLRTRAVARATGGDLRPRAPAAPARP